MACLHPMEERQRVFEGRAEPRPDRGYCGLCGAVLYMDAREWNQLGPMVAVGLLVSDSWERDRAPREPGEAR